MEVRAIRSFVDKYSMKSIPKGKEIEVTEERFSELTAGPRGVFVEEIKEDPSMNPQKQSSQVDELHPTDLNTDDLEQPIGEVKETNFESMTKKELVEYAKGKSVELNMESTKKEMIEILLKK
jgi:LAS superfamily LD-carboxypeptidase LdcB